MSGGLFTSMLLRETGYHIDPERIERLRNLHAVQDQHLGASDAIRQATQAKEPQEIVDIRDEPPSPVREISASVDCCRMRLSFGGQDRLRRLPSAGQRRLDRAHIPAGIQRFARKEYGATIRFSQRQLRFPCFGSCIGIGAACERVIAPVDRL